MKEAGEKYYSDGDNCESGDNENKLKFHNPDNEKVFKEIIEIENELMRASELFKEVRQDTESLAEQMHQVECSIHEQYLKKILIPNRDTDLNISSSRNIKLFYGIADLVVLKNQGQSFKRKDNLIFKQIQEIAPDIEINDSEKDEMLKYIEGELGQHVIKEEDRERKYSDSSFFIRNGQIRKQLDALDEYLNPKKIIGELFSDKRLKDIKTTDQNLSDELPGVILSDFQVGNLGSVIQLVFRLRWMLETKWMIADHAGKELGLNFDSYCEEAEKIIDKTEDLEEIIRGIAEKGNRYYHNMRPGDVYRRSDYRLEGDLKYFTPTERGLFEKYIPPEEIDIDGADNDSVDLEDGHFYYNRLFDVNMLGYYRKDGQSTDEHCRTRVVCVSGKTKASQ